MDNLGDNTAAMLRAFIERIERLEEEKKALSGDIKGIYAEAKANGFDPKTMRKVVRLRAMDADKRRAEQVILDFYMEALGMLAGTPLGDAALGRAIREFGTPVPLTEEETAKGMSAAFETKYGHVSVGTKLA